MKTIDVIQREHKAIAAVLEALEFVVGAIRAGRLVPDFLLLAAMIDYITLVPEQVHHPKEDRFLFPPLAARSPEAAGIVALLEQEHADGYRMTGALALALIHYMSVGAAGFAAFDRCVSEYVAFNWKHLNREEGELLPLARRVLTREDWAAIDAEFARNCDPYAGAEGEFEGLFRRIVNLTPAPYGLGPASG
jgi:branched-chain amino acid transport system ATP-binding protein